MTHDQAVWEILHGTPHERLMAARDLMRSAIPEDLPTLEHALQKESVLWTRTALSDVIKKLQAGSSDVNEEQPLDSTQNEVSEDYVRDLHAQALREVTGLIIHEIQPLVGSLTKAMMDDIPDFEKSRSCASLQVLKDMMKVLVELRSASTSPMFSQFDLEELIRSTCEEVSTGSSLTIQLAGRRPFIIVSDPVRIRLALANGLRNAIEATLSLASPNLADPIVVTWSSRPEEFWIAILDCGKGLSSEASRAFAIGSTTKKGHFGMGLPLALQAIAAIGGDINLSSREPQGAKLEIRWPKYSATEVSSIEQADA